MTVIKTVVDRKNWRTIAEREVEYHRLHPDAPRQMIITPLFEQYAELASEVHRYCSQGNKAVGISKKNFDYLMGKIDELSNKYWKLGREDYRCELVSPLRDLINETRARTTIRREAG